MNPDPITERVHVTKFTTAKVICWPLLRGGILEKEAQLYAGLGLKFQCVIILDLYTTHVFYALRRKIKAIPLLSHVDRKTDACFFTKFASLSMK